MISGLFLFVSAIQKVDYKILKTGKAMDVAPVKEEATRGATLKKSGESAQHQVSFVDFFFFLS